MGFRIRQSIRIAPGLRLNVGMKSVSVSTGVRGLSCTAGSSGQRVTVGLPGTGLFWTKAWRSSAGPHSVSPAYLVAAGFFVLFGLSIVLFVLSSH
jgi:hypothetical protein